MYDWNGKAKPCLNWNLKTIQRAFVDTRNISLTHRRREWNCVKITLYKESTVIIKIFDFIRLDKVPASHCEETRNELAEFCDMYICKNSKFPPIHPKNITDSPTRPG